METLEEHDLIGNIVVHYAVKKGKDSFNALFDNKSLISVGTFIVFV
jgi:hypothetical protein